MKKTWTRNDLIEEVSNNVGLPLSESSKIIEQIIEEILFSLEKLVSSTDCTKIKIGAPFSKNFARVFNSYIFFCKRYLTLKYGVFRGIKPP